MTTIFDFAAAFAITATAFIFPGLFYLKGIKRYGGSSKKFIYMSYLYLVLGAVTKRISSLKNCLKILE